MMEGIEPEYLRQQAEYLERLRLGEGGMKEYGKHQDQPVIRTYVTYGMHEEPIPGLIPMDTFLISPVFPV